MAIAIQAHTGCNLGCTYCYEEPDRKYSESEIKSDYDLDAILDRLKGMKDELPDGDIPMLHGGEPLLLPDEDLERIFSWVYDEYSLGETDRYSSIQTNGTLLTDDHIELFKKYNVSVGLSCDGPAELNEKRVARSEMGGEQRDITDSMTERTLDALDRLKKSEVPTGVIVVVTEQNAGSDEKLERLHEWMDDLTKHGVSGHFNPAIPYEDIQEDDSLSPERLKEVYLQTWEWVKEKSYREWSPMNDYQDNLLGLDLENCHERQCDVFNAGAAKKVKGDGSVTGCGLTWSAAGDGNAFLQGEATDSEFNSTDERYVMLKQIPGKYTEGEQDQGGCHGCRYWNVCQGGCPSNGLNFDYRNRTRWCEPKYALYEKIEEDMRGMFPGLQLITDAPWDADLATKTPYDVDINPFARMNHEQAEDPSVNGGQTDESSVEETAKELSQTD